MRKAFDGKGKVQVGKMVESMSKVTDGSLSVAVESIRRRHGEESKRLDEKFRSPDGEAEKAKKEREKKMKDAKAKNDENAAKALAQLLLDRFDPKAILKEAGLRSDGIPVDMALFGRMVASPLMHNVEASSQFAHAISTHEFTREFDLWTRVDDRRDKRLDWYRDAFGAEEKLESGTDGMGDAEFTSACFYSYFNVDFDALVDNLTGKAINQRLEVPQEDQKKAMGRASDAVIGLLRAAIWERPTGKFNSMSTPSLPTLVLVELRYSHVPVSYADAFAKPVDPKNEEEQSDTGQVQHVDMPMESARRLVVEANRITKAFCRSAVNRLLFTGGRDIGASLDKLDTAPVRSVDTVQDLVAELRTVLGCPKEKRDA
ncbi:MAG: type I-E CRISPR-associated protein Cas7/Cse4/CasC [Thermodesulfobacteriota bacterium]